MPDINLLKDTKEGNESQPKKPKRVPPAPVTFSSPERSDEKGKPLKKPSGLILWFRSLFERPKAGKAPSVAIPPPPPPPRSAPKTTSPRRVEPEDIFAGLATVSGGPETKKPPAPQPSSPTGSRPGDFPPLPRIPPAPDQKVGVAGRGSGVTTPPVSPFGRGSRFSTPPAPPSPPPPRMRIPPASPLRPLPPTEDQGFDGVNLLPEELVTTFDPKKKLTTIGLTALATALAIGILEVALLLWQETRVQKTEEKRAEVTATIQNIKSLENEQRKAILLKSSNDIIRQLLNRHVYWTKFLDSFERYTLPTVFYPGGLTIDVGGGISLTGIAPDIETITQQLTIYQTAANFIKDIKIDSISRSPEGGGYGFVADFTFLPDVYYNPIDQSSGGGNTTTNTNSRT